MVTFQTKLLICAAKGEEGKHERDRKKRGGGGKKEMRGVIAPCHTLEAQSPLETVAASDQGMTVHQYRVSTSLHFH